MVIKILAFSDIHGNIDAVRKMMDVVEGRRYNAIIFAGDFSNSTDRVQEDAKETIAFLSTLHAPVFYVLGNRDRSSLASIASGILLNGGKKYEIGEGIYVTSDPKLVDRKTIFVEHKGVLLAKGALLHIEGHTHNGVVVGNYLNTGFLFRDVIHKAKPTLGGFFEVIIETMRIKSINWTPLGEIKEIKCPKHTEFRMFEPSSLYGCPLCRFPERLDKLNRFLLRES